MSDDRAANLDGSQMVWAVGLCLQLLQQNLIGESAANKINKIVSARMNLVDAFQRIK